MLNFTDQHCSTQCYSHHMCSNYYSTSGQTAYTDMTQSDML